MLKQRRWAARYWEWLAELLQEAGYEVHLVVGGAGFGLAFLGSLRALSAQIPPAHRAGVMSAFFIAAYAALCIPAVLAGFAAGPLGLDATFEILGSPVAALALLVAVQAWRTRHRPAASTTMLARDAT